MESAVAGQLRSSTFPELDLIAPLFRPACRSGRRLLSRPPGGGPWQLCQQQHSFGQQVSNGRWALRMQAAWTRPPAPWCKVSHTHVMQGQAADSQSSTLAVPAACLRHLPSLPPAWAMLCPCRAAEADRGEEGGAGQGAAG